MRLPAAQSFLHGSVASCLVLAGLAVAGPLTQSQSTKLQGNWSRRAPLLTKRGEVAVAALNGKIYVLGGSALGQTASQLNQEYDPAGDRWRDRAPIPQGTSHAGVAGYNGKIYVIGGFTANVHVGALDRVFEYELSTDSWRQLAPLSSPRGSVGVAVVGGKVHAIGGRGLDKVTVATHEVYGLILYAGGECKGGNTFSENEGYDPKTNRWLTLEPLPMGRHAFGAAAVGQYAYFAGGALGCGGGSLSDELLVFRLP
ncbi:MAG: hypothetical protein DMG32_20085 [Acidobacteria bacterium]|nr:MAG: hypothetical protein DMG32_20085 [Acidobacteriota bacterium]